MNATSIDIKDMLVAQVALGLTFATNLFVGKQPATPDNCVTIFDTPGFRTEQTNDSGLYNQPGVQIRVRNNDYVTGYNLAKAIETYLLSVQNETWNTTMYTVFISNSGVFFMQWDDNSNAEFIINFDIQRR